MSVNSQYRPPRHRLSVSRHAELAQRSPSPRQRRPFSSAAQSQTVFFCQPCRASVRNPGKSSCFSCQHFSSQNPRSAKRPVAIFPLLLQPCSQLTYTTASCERVALSTSTRGTQPAGTVPTGGLRCHSVNRRRQCRTCSPPEGRGLGPFRLWCSSRPS